MKKTSFFPKSALSKVLLCLVFIAFVFFPFTQMVMKITPEDFSDVFNSPSFLPALFTSIKCAVSTTAISVLLGFLLACQGEFCTHTSAVCPKFPCRIDRDNKVEL